MNSSEHNSAAYQDDEIDLRELFSILWKGKWWIIGVTFVFALASVAVALYLPNEYKATAVVQPNDSGGSSGKLASLAGQFGGLASLAGINLGAGESSDAVIAMEVIKSWGFAEDFINKYNLQVPLFAAKGWSQSDNKLILDPELYDDQVKKWIRIPPKGKTVEPTSWELYKRYKEVFSVSQDKETGLVSLSAVYYSPKLAESWVGFLVQEINQYMKQKSLKESSESIKYLEQQILTTSVAEIRVVFSQLIQEQHKTKMLAQVSKEFAFKTISSARAPEEKAKPKRSLIVLLGVFFGGVIGVLFVFVLNIFRKS